MKAASHRRLIVFALVVLAIAGRQWLLHARAVPAVTARPLNELPAQLGPWHMTAQTKLNPDILRVLAASDYLVRFYRDPRGDEADLFVAYYRSQTAGVAMHSPKNCLPGAGWVPVVQGYVPLDPGQPKSPRINRFIIQNGDARELVLYWYLDQGHIVANEYWGKARLVWDALRTGRRDGAIVRITVPIAGPIGPSQATRIALGFAHSAQPYLNRLLPQ